MILEGQEVPVTPDIEIMPGIIQSVDYTMVQGKEVETGSLIGETFLGQVITDYPKDAYYPPQPAPGVTGSVAGWTPTGGGSYPVIPESGTPYLLAENPYSGLGTTPLVEVISPSTPDVPLPTKISLNGGSTMDITDLTNGGVPYFPQVAANTLPNASGTVSGTPVLAPVVLATLSSLLPIILNLVSSGKLSNAVSMLKNILGSSWLKWLLAAVGAGLLGLGVYNLLKGQATHAKGRGRRYSIGTNPRLGTLIKVSKRCDKITRRFGSRMRHAGLIRTSTRHSYYPVRRRS